MITIYTYHKYCMAPSTQVLFDSENKNTNPFIFTQYRKQ